MAKIIASTKKNPWVDSWMVAGTSGHKYRVSRRADGVTFGCECKTWVYAPAPKPDCQHILKQKLEIMQAKLNQQEQKPIKLKTYNMSNINAKPEQVVSIKSYDDYAGTTDMALAEKHGLDQYLYNNLKNQVLKIYQIEGQKIPAIKYVWNYMKTTIQEWGLVESKNFVDDIIAIFPLTGTNKPVTVLKHHVKTEVEHDGRRFRGEDE